MWRLSAAHSCCLRLSVCAAEWRTTFPVDANNLGIDGRNPYFPLQPGHTLHLVRGKVREYR